MQDTADTVMAFLRKTIDSELKGDTQLIESGLLDSFHVVELLSFVESEFDLRLSPTDVTQEDLRTPQSIVDLVIRLKQRSVTAG
jgi:acyl carrier protein